MGSSLSPKPASEQKDTFIEALTVFVPLSQTLYRCHKKELCLEFTTSHSKSSKVVGFSSCESHGAKLHWLGPLNTGIEMKKEGKCMGKSGLNTDPKVWGAGCCCCQGPPLPGQFDKPPEGGGDETVTETVTANAPGGRQADASSPSPLCCCCLLSTPPGSRRLRLHS